MALNAIQLTQEGNTEKAIIDALLEKLRRRHSPVSDILESNIISVLFGFLGPTVPIHRRVLACRAIKLITTILKGASENYSTGKYVMIRRIDQTFKLSMINSLVSCLGQDESELIQASASALCNITTTSKHLLRVAKRCDFMPSVLQLIHKMPPELDVPRLAMVLKAVHDHPEGEEDNLKAAVLWMVLKAFKEQHLKASRELLLQLFPILNHTMTRGVQPLDLERACKILCCLLDEGDPDRTLLVVQFGLCLPLDKLLLHDSSEVSGTALKCVRNIAQGGSSQSQVLVESGVWGKIRSFLHRSDGSVVEDALVAAKHILTHREIRRTLVNDVIMDSYVLSYLTAHTNVKVKTAANVLWNMCMSWGTQN